MRVRGKGNKSESEWEWVRVSECEWVRVDERVSECESANECESKE